jgi:glutamate-1-semialdehyde 2,1-aminomutase
MKGPSCSPYYVCKDMNKDISLPYKTLFMQEMFFQGVLILGSHNVTLAHDSEAIQIVAESYTKALQKLKLVESAQSYSENLFVDPLKPLFKVR